MFDLGARVMKNVATPCLVTMHMLNYLGWSRRLRTERVRTITCPPFNGSVKMAAACRCTVSFFAKWTCCPCREGLNVRIQVCSLTPFVCWTCQVILSCSALPCLLHLLSSPKESIKKEACWTVSNITAGNRAQIQVQPDPCESNSMKRVWPSALLLLSECDGCQHFPCPDWDPSESRVPHEEGSSVGHH